MKKNMFIAVVLSVLVLVGASFLQELLYQIGRAHV